MEWDGMNEGRYLALALPLQVDNHHVHDRTEVRESLHNLYVRIIDVRFGIQLKMDYATLTVC